MALSGRAQAVVPVAISGLVLVVAHLHCHLELVLPFVPLLLLFVSLLVGVYPGCETIVRLVERARLRRRRAVSSAPRPISRDGRVPSGGLLIALGLAQRPPPLAA